ncbi:(No apical meristem) protein [Musa troglodytarum]|uniref:(No apical meristem) protein n=1 Tax=Musa troglodytarum TaxID=320322 RepID=A0A9E7F0F8_9LILI|nr:(No apical meristem) protein [Musa troglodytarum]
MSGGDDGKDGHEHDLVMPGFRFHPTEEELFEFYLRRKIEGKRFNVELIPFLDLYRYDPWELPALGAIGEKEWFFYVPRDRKYRNGDRPNRVTRSGYWKATGADRIIRGENHRGSIGLKKTLVFYSGKAPKGIRTSWIMNEYRLPHGETVQCLRAEISLCRVYKRTGVADHLQLPGPLASRPSSSRGTAKLSCTRRQLPGVDPSLALVMEKVPILQGATPTNNLSSPILSTVSTASMEEDSAPLHHSKNSLLSSTNYSMTTPEIEELNRFVSYDHSFMNPPNTPSVTLPPQPQLAPLNQLTMSLSMISDKLWEWWNPVPEVGKDYSGFK